MSLANYYNDETAEQGRLLGCFVWYHATMKDFFHGWRRKAGVVALGLACGPMAMWLRSIVCYDFFRIASRHLLFCLESRHGKMWAYILRRQNKFKAVTWESGYLDDDPVEVIFGWEWPEFDASPNDWALIAPYWLYVIPLTLLSAYLILWKPRKRV